MGVGVGVGGGGLEGDGLMKVKENVEIVIEKMLDCFPVHSSGTMPKGRFTLRSHLFARFYNYHLCASATSLCLRA